MINLGEKIEQEYSVGEFLVENQEKLKEIKERNDTLSDMVQQLEDCYHENLYIFKRTLSDVFLFMMEFKLIQSYQRKESYAILDNLVNRLTYMMMDIELEEEVLSKPFIQNEAYDDAYIRFYRYSYDICNRDMTGYELSAQRDTSIYDINIVLNEKLRYKFLYENCILEYKRKYKDMYESIKEEE